MKAREGHCERWILRITGAAEFAALTPFILNKLTVADNLDREPIRGDWALPHRLLTTPPSRHYVLAFIADKQMTT